MESCSKVFLELSLDTTNLDTTFPQSLRLEFELFTGDCPKLTSHFISLCKGVQHNGSFKSYRNCRFFRIIPGHFAICGDIQRNNGSGSFCLEPSGYLNDENLTSSHNKRGLLATYNQGPDKNDSQFIITFGKCEWLDGRHCVFGRLTDRCLSDLIWLEKLQGLDGSSENRLVVSNCGVCK
ncbi:hypothetical protein P9112_002396 [Eukaryota sp. TZLM1-RC]